MIDWLININYEDRAKLTSFLYSLRFIQKDNAFAMKKVHEFTNSDIKVNIRNFSKFENPKHKVDDIAAGNREKNIILVYHQKSYQVLIMKQI